MKTTANKTKKKTKIDRRALLPWLIISGVLAAILVGAAIYSMVEDNPARKVYSVTYNGEDGSIYEAENDHTYLPAPFCYEAVLNASSDYPYARVKAKWSLFDDSAKANEKFNTFYQVGYRDENDKLQMKSGSAWLCRAKEFGGQVFYNPALVDFPEFSEFDWKEIYFTNPDQSQFSTYTLDYSTTDALMKAYTDPNAKNVYGEIYGEKELDIKLTLKVASYTYRWLYLNLNLVEDEEGNYYLYPEGSSSDKDCRMIQVDKVYFEDYLKTLEEILGGTVTE